MKRATVGRATDAVMVAGVLGASFLAGTPAIAYVAGKGASLAIGAIAQNVAASHAERGYYFCRRTFLSETVAQNHDLRRAMERAFAKAVKDLAQTWWETPRGRQQRGVKEDHAAISGLFATLADDAAEVLSDTGSFAPYRNADELRRLESGERIARQALEKYLTTYLRGHDEYLQVFVRKNLEPWLARAFAEELKADTPAGNRAWRAFQRMVFDALLAELADVRAGQEIALAELGDARQRLDDILVHLDRLTDEQRDTAGESGLNQVLEEKGNRIVAALVEQFKVERNEAQLWFDAILTTVESQAEQTQSHVTAAHVETRSAIDALSQQTAAGLAALQNRLSQLSGYSVVAAELGRARELVERGAADTRDFYNGTKPRWTDIIAQHDAPRTITRDIVDFVVRFRANPVGVPVALVHARSGDGKTTIAMRTASQLVECGLNVVWQDAASRDLSWKQLAEACRSEPVVVFIDDAQRFEPEQLESFFGGLNQVGARVIAVLFARRDLWFGSDVRIEDMSKVQEFPCDRLDDQEIGDILGKLETAGELGRLASLSQQERINRFKEMGDGQLLIAMLEAKESEAFPAIVQRSIRDLRRFGNAVVDACYIVSALHTFDIECSPEILGRLLGIRSVSADVLAKAKGTLVGPEEGPNGIQMRHAIFATTVFQLDEGRYDRLRNYIETALTMASCENPEDTNVPNAIVRLVHNIRSRAQLLQLDPGKVRTLYATAAAWPGDTSRILTEWALSERQKQQLDEARRLFAKATETNPTYYAAWMEWGKLEEEQRDFAGARRLYQKATEVAPLSAITWLAWANLEVEVRDFAAARRLYQKASDKVPLNARVWLDWGQLEKEQHDFTEARRLYQKATETIPTNSAIWLAWSHLEKLQRDFPVARQLIQKATELVPLHPHAWMEWGNLEKEQRDFTEARRLYRMAINVAPTYVNAWHAWAILEKERHDFAKARRLFQKATEVAPLDANAWLAWAMLEKGQRDFTEARRLYQKATEVGTPSSGAWLAWAILEKEQHDFPQARRLYRKATEIAPLNAQAWLEWGHLEKEQRDFAEARRLYQKATEVDPLSANAWLAWATLEKEQGQASDVRKLYRKAAEFGPSNSAAWQAWAIFEKEQGEIAKARELFQQAVKVWRQNSAAWQAWAILEKEQGEIAKARELFQQATTVGPQNSAAWQAWGLLELEACDGPRALELAEQAVYLRPSNPYNLVARARVLQSLGHPQKAYADFETARLALESKRNILPADIKLRALLADVLINLKYWDRAKDVIREAVRNAPPGEVHYAYDRLGDLFEATNQHAGAVAAWEKALSFMPYYYPSRKKLGRFK